MSEITLQIENEVVLPPILESMRYSTNKVTNYVQEQTLEKGYVPVSATSKNTNSVTWDIPSISGGFCHRSLDVQVPLEFTITYTNNTSEQLNISPDLTINNLGQFTDNGGAILGAGVAITPAVGIPAIRPFMQQHNLSLIHI